MITVKTEADHLRELEDAMQRAVAAATALGFYRNQSGWMKVAALLDNVAKGARELARRRVN